MFPTVLLLLSFLAVLGLTTAPPPAQVSMEGCPYAAGLCPSDCGQREDANGCRRCLCGVPYFRWPQRQCPMPRRHCPLDCGHMMDDNGCRKCMCGTNPFYRFPWMARPAKKPALPKHVLRPPYSIPSTPRPLPPTTRSTTAAPPHKQETEPVPLLDVRTFEGPPKRAVSNGSANHLPGDGFVF